MSTIVTRAGKGSPLTNTEVDANFTNLNTDKYESGDNVSLGTGTFSGAVGFGGSISVSTAGGTGRVVFFKDNAATPTKYNWVIGTQYTRDNGFEITPSTTLGGGTYSYPSISGTVSETIFNDGSQNRDFRVESDTNTHALFVDAGNSRVGINTSTPGYALDINGGLRTNELSDINSYKIVTGKAFASWGAGTYYYLCSVKPFSNGSSATFDLTLGITGRDGSVKAMVVVRNVGGTAFANLTVYETNLEGVTIAAYRDPAALNTLHFYAQSSTGVSYTPAIMVAGAQDVYNDAAAPSTPPSTSYTWSCDAVTTVNLSVSKGAVFNESGADADFRVESDTNTHALFVDAGADKVKIGTSVNGNSNTKLVVQSNMELYFSAAESMSLGLGQGTSGAASWGIQVNDSGDGNNNLALNGTTGSVTIGTSNISGLGAGDLRTSGGAIFNEDSEDRDFRVESDTNTHALFVDASDNAVIMGDSSHAGKVSLHLLQVGGSGGGGQINISGGYTPDAALNIRDLGGNIASFFVASSKLGSITASASGTTYNTTSDRRLKENIETITDGTDKLMAMNPVRHTWKADPEAPAVHGFIAQEMQDVIPEAVSGEDGGDEMMSMDYGRITPVIVAALQDAHREIQNLKAEIAALKEAK